MVGLPDARLSEESLACASTTSCSPTRWRNAALPLRHRSRDAQALNAHRTTRRSSSNWPHEPNAISPDELLALYPALAALQVTNWKRFAHRKRAPPAGRHRLFAERNPAAGFPGDLRHHQGRQELRLPAAKCCSTASNPAAPASSHPVACSATRPTRRAAKRRVGAADAGPADSPLFERLLAGEPLSAISSSTSSPTALPN